MKLEIEKFTLELDGEPLPDRPNLVYEMKGRSTLSMNYSHPKLLELFDSDQATRQ